MKVTYDEQTDALYCHFSNREVACTIQVSRDVLVDLDSDDNLRGISIIGASRVFPSAPYAGILNAESGDELGEWPFWLPMGHAG